MSVDTHIVEGPVPPTAASAFHSLAGAFGAVLVFDGMVRGLEDGRQLVALEYEAYEPMASRELRAIASNVVEKHGLIGLRCTHSRGRVGVGECSLRVVVHSKHRAEALAAVGEFIDRLKRDVPIWKKPVWT